MKLKSKLDAYNKEMEKIDSAVIYLIKLSDIIGGRLCLLSSDEKGFAYLSLRYIKGILQRDYDDCKRMKKEEKEKITWEDTCVQFPNSKNKEEKEG